MNELELKLMTEGTFRDRVALQVLPSLIAKYNFSTFHAYVAEAYRFADTLIAYRAEGEKND